MQARRRTHHWSSHRYFAKRGGFGFPVKGEMPVGRSFTASAIWELPIALGGEIAPRPTQFMLESEELQLLALGAEHLCPGCGSLRPCSPVLATGYTRLKLPFQ
jgi:hypothetical protein